MASFNKVIIVGNCGKDPEVRYLQSGMAVANVSVATSRKRKDKTTGEAIEETQWHRVVFYDKLAEIVEQYVRKGSSILVEGSIRYGKYEGKEGQTIYTTDIVAEQMQMMGGRQDGQQGGEGQGRAPRQQQAPQQPQRQRQRPQGGAYQDARGGGSSRPSNDRQPPARSQPPAPNSGFNDMDDDMDDDIPF